MQYASHIGVVRTRVGYAGGSPTHVPSYHNMGDYTESIQIDFDATKITYGKLLDLFFSCHDFSNQCSTQYASCIFYHNDEQKQQAQASAAKQVVPVGTRIEKMGKFFAAEDYHQKYYLQGDAQLRQVVKGMSKQQLTESPLCCKLNAIAGGIDKVVQQITPALMQELPQDKQTLLKQVLKL